MPPDTDWVMRGRSAETLAWALYGERAKTLRSHSSSGKCQGLGGWSLYSADRFKDASTVFRDALNDDPGLAVEYSWAALARTGLGQHDEAIDAAVRAPPASETSATLATRGFVLAKAQKTVEADQIGDRLIAAPPYGYVSPLQLALKAKQRYTTLAPKDTMPGLCSGRK